MSAWKWVQVYWFFSENCIIFKSSWKLILVYRVMMTRILNCTMWSYYYFGVSRNNSRIWSIFLRKFFYFYLSFGVGGGHCVTFPYFFMKIFWQKGEGVKKIHFLIDVTHERPNKNIENNFCSYISLIILSCFPSHLPILKLRNQP